MNERRMTKTNTAVDNIGYALYAFGGLGIEILLVLAETNLYGCSSDAWSFAAHMVHWILTCLIWGCLGILLIKRLPVIAERDVKSGNLIAAGIIILISVMYTSIVWKGFKPAIELAKLGAAKFFAQYCYYAFESLLIVLMIAFGQKALESWFGKGKCIPFGGIFLAATWGMIHIFTQGATTGIYAFVQSLLYGSVYLLFHKNFKISYVAIALMFMI